MNNEKALANSARGYVKALKETRITIAAVIKDWNICVSQAGMVGTFDFPTTGYTRKVQLIADLERCAAQLDNLAAGLTAEGHMILNEEDNREWCGADIEAAHAEALEINAVIDDAVSRCKPFCDNKNLDHASIINAVDVVRQRLPKMGCNARFTVEMMIAVRRLAKLARQKAAENYRAMMERCAKAGYGCDEIPF